MPLKKNYQFLIQSQNLLKVRLLQSEVCLILNWFRVFAFCLILLHFCLLSLLSSFFLAENMKFCVHHWKEVAESQAAFGWHQNLYNYSD